MLLFFGNVVKAKLAACCRFQTWWDQVCESHRGGTEHKTATAAAVQLQSPLVRLWTLAYQRFLMKLLQLQRWGDSQTCCGVTNLSSSLLSCSQISLLWLKPLVSPAVSQVSAVRPTAPTLQMSRSSNIYSLHNRHETRVHLTYKYTLVNNAVKECFSREVGVALRKCENVRNLDGLQLLRLQDSKSSCTYCARGRSGVTAEWRWGLGGLQPHPVLSSMLLKPFALWTKSDLLRAQPQIQPASTRLGCSWRSQPGWHTLFILLLPRTKRLD